MNIYYFVAQKQSVYGTDSEIFYPLPYLFQLLSDQYLVICDF